MENYQHGLQFVNEFACHRGGRVCGRELRDLERAPVAGGAPVGRWAAKRGAVGLKGLAAGVGGTHLSGVGAPPVEAGAPLEEGAGCAPNAIG